MDLAKGLAETTSSRSAKAKVNLKIPSKNRIFYCWLPLVGPVVREMPNRQQPQRVALRRGQLPHSCLVRFRLMRLFRKQGLLLFRPQEHFLPHVNLCCSLTRNL